VKTVGVLAAAFLLLAGGYVAADAGDAVPGPLTTRRVIPDPAPYPDPTAVPAVAPTVAGSPAPVPVGDLQGFVDDLAAGAPLSASLVDIATGEVVGAAEPTTPRPPASSLKLLTAAAALEDMGPGHTLATTATWDGRTLTLVGGGDLLLSVGDAAGEDAGAPGASLTDLAAQVAEPLGEAAVALAVDDTLFTGPVHAADWGAIDRLFVMPMASLAVGAGRSDGSTWDSDPAVVAARLFAAELTAAGVTVVGDPVRAPSPAGATEVGRVESAPLSEVVRHMLKESDNSVAEALGRLVSLHRGGPGTAEGATGAVSAAITDLGLPTEGMVLRDTSGLSSGTRVTTELLTGLLVASLGHPRLRSLVPSLPVAHLDGTLVERIGGAAGQVRAKTGTLLTVVSLTGVVRTDGGGAVAFSVILPGLELGGVEAGRQRLDEFVTLLASAGG
jgi:D-alanyl-D-alanine carboxypeptidase/D-alanyl-D-alanine-endopeptidase (penicillin-binding protein 4)